METQERLLVDARAPRPRWWYKADTGAVAVISAGDAVKADRGGVAVLLFGAHQVRGVGSKDSPGRARPAHVTGYRPVPAPSVPAEQQPGTERRAEDKRRYGGGRSSRWI